MKPATALSRVDFAATGRAEQDEAIGRVDFEADPLVARTTRERVRYSRLTPSTASRASAGSVEGWREAAFIGVSTPCNGAPSWKK